MSKGCYKNEKYINIGCLQKVNSRREKERKKKNRHEKQIFSVTIIYLQKYKKEGLF